MDLFDSGATHAITIFALRRMGKTELCLRDIAPLALKQGYDVRYASFWSDKSNPQSVLLEAISQQNHDLQSIKASLGVGSTYIEAMRETTKPNPEDRIEEIARQFKKLAKGRKKVLLILDEVQQLAATPNNETFIAAFRTLLDTHKNKVSVVFTGSSREALMAMFKRQKAPLFNFSHQFELPDLESDFVAFMLAAFKKTNGKTIPLAPALRVFKVMKRVPASFHDLLRAMLINGRNDIEKAHTEYKASSQETGAFQLIWESLKPLDREVLKRIAVDDVQIYSEVVRSTMAEALGLDNIPKATVQRSIARLKEGHLIESFARRTFEFTDMAFQNFVEMKIEA